MVEQLVEQYDPQENVEPILRRFTRERRSSILDEYIVYLQESDSEFEVENDLIMFSETMNCRESNLWFDTIKEEMNSIASNGV